MCSTGEADSSISSTADGILKRMLKNWQGRRNNHRPICGLEELPSKERLKELYSAHPSRRWEVD